MLMLLVMLPFWTSFLLRVYAWIGILKNNGLLNNFLICDRRHRPADPDAADRFRRLHRHRLLVPAVHDPAAVRQPREDGPDACSRPRPTSAASPGRRFLKITLPLSMPGIIAGCMLVFIPAVGEFVIPSLLGGPGTLMIGKVLWNEFFNNRDWPVASAVAIAMLLFLVIPIMFFQRAQRRRSGRGRTPMNQDRCWFRIWCWRLGFAFLYMPIVSLIVYSFNKSRLVTVWGGFSTKWYGELLRNDADPERRLAQPARSRRSRRRWPSCSARLPAWCWRASARSRAARCVGPDHGAAGDARSDHRSVAAAAVRDDGAADRLARRAAA